MTELQDFPLSPQEAFMVSDTNRFPKEQIYNQLEKVLSNDEYKYKGQVGYLLREGNEIKFKPGPVSYLDPDDKTGEYIVVYEHPDHEGFYEKLYIAAADPYMQEEGGTSCASFYVYKRFASPSKSSNQIVAAYYGRANSLDKLYDNWLLLCQYYNATLMFENNIMGPIPYFDKQNAKSYLANSPLVVKTVLANSRVDRRYGVHMTSDIKEWGLNKIRDWCLTENSGGGINVDHIYDEGLLRELLAWEPEGNYDRISAMIVLMVYIEDLAKIQPKSRDLRNPIFSSLFNTYGF
jgi:hypothetical protein